MFWRFPPQWRCRIWRRFDYWIFTMVGQQRWIENMSAPSFLNKHCFGMCRKLWITNHANAIRALVFLQLQATCVLGIVFINAKWFQLSLCHVKVTLKPCHMPSSLFFVLFYCFTLYPDLLEKNTITIFIYLLYIHIYYSVLIIQIKVRWPKHCINIVCFCKLWYWVQIFSSLYFFIPFFKAFLKCKILMKIHSENYYYYYSN